MKPLAVFGDPIHHSLSPVIHRMFAEETGVAVDYRAILAPESTFPQQFERFFQQHGVGANITLPHKTRVLGLVDEVSERALLAGAVNTVTKRGGTLWGDNTDGEGLVADLLRLGITLSGARVLIIGAGGAVRGILGPLLEQQVAEVFIFNRTLSKAQALVEHFSTDTVKLADSFQPLATDVLINASSAGHSGEFPPLPAHWLQRKTQCYDLSYGQAAAPFLGYAASRALAAHDGLGMLVGQAAASFKIWTGKTPNAAAVLAELRRSV